MYQPKLGVSLKTIGPLNDETLRAVAESSIATVELSAWKFLDDNPQAIMLPALKEMLRRTGIRATSMHVAYGADTDISALDEQIYRRGMDQMALIVGLAVELDVGIIVAHASVGTVEPDERDRRIAQIRRALAEIEPLCSEAGRKFAIELIPRTGLGNTPEEILSLIDGRNESIFGACLDTNHLVERCATLPQVVRTLSDRLLTLHMSDCDGLEARHLPPGEGAIDWKAFMEALRDIDYRGPFTYECHLPSETPKQKVRALEENFNWLSRL